VNAYEAKYIKQYSGFNTFGKSDVTAVTKLGQLIDSSWHYSWHWPEDVNNEFIERVKKDLDTEIERANARIAELKLAESILSKIEISVEDD
jgi:hypothetical protein